MAPAAGPATGAPAAAAGPTATPAAYAAYPPAPQGAGPQDPKVDSAIGEVTPMAPSDCKKWVKAMCRNAAIPDGNRLQMCAAYVSTINQLVKQQGAKAADACKSMMQSAPQ